MKPRVQLLLLLAFAVCLRLVFINQAFQLDDPNYLAAAKYMQTDPWHPFHASYVFLGQMVNMRGHPHPPFDGLFLGLAMKLTGGDSEVPLHAIYILFTLVSVAAVFALASRFTRRPGLATLLFMATPAFVVHGNAIEADVPFLALWLAAAATFIYALDRASALRMTLAYVLLALASLAAYQAVFLGPVLAVYAWMRKRDWRAAVLACAVPVVTIGGYQLYERLAGGTLPASVFMGYMQQGGYQSLANKWKNAMALTAHLGWVVFPLLALAAFAWFGRKLWTVVVFMMAMAVLADSSPLFWVSFGVGVVVLLASLTGLRDADRDAAFLRLWVLLFFGGALVIFFAGAARYLLPLAAAVAMLATRELEKRPKVLVAAFVLQFFVSMGLAASHYQHSNGYRAYTRQMASQISAHRTFLNGEWGFQYYGQAAGARPLLRDTELQAGDLLLTSRLGFPLAPRLAPGTMRKMVAEMRIVPALPLRVIAIEGHSAFSSVAFGVRPFGLCRSPSDVLTAEEIVLREPALSYLPMNAPRADDQIVSGLFGLENNSWRWMGGRAVLELKRPEGISIFELVLYLPPSAAARRVSASIDGVAVLEKELSAPGPYTIVSEPLQGSPGRALVTIAVDRTFSPPGDSRELGIILNAAGFKPVK